MTELTALDPNMLMFDARLTAIDAAAHTASFVCGGVEYTRRLAFPPFWQPGIVGALHLHPDEEHFDFYVYPDQRLRRALDRDRENLLWWSWAIGEHHFYVRAGIIPGVAGAVVKDECEPIEVPLPPEFTAFCRGGDLDPEQLLRAFIADSSGIQDSRRCPREDQYCSTGADQRFLAREYVRLLKRARPAIAATDEVRRSQAGPGA